VIIHWILHENQINTIADNVKLFIKMGLGFQVNRTSLLVGPNGDIQSGCFLTVDSMTPQPDIAFVPGLQMGFHHGSLLLT